MKINIKSTNFELTGAIEQYVETKIGSIRRLLSDEAADLVDASVEVGKPSLHHHTGPVFTTEVNFHMGGMLFRATSENEDLYTSIDRAKDELERQIIKFKDKKQSQLRRTDPDAEVAE